MEELDEAIHAPLNDRDLRNWYRELNAPAAEIGELINNLVFEVPRQDQHVIRRGFENPLQWEKRNMVARQILAFLTGVAINRVVQKISVDAAIVDKVLVLPGTL